MWQTGRLSWYALPKSGTKGPQGRVLSTQVQAKQKRQPKAPVYRKSPQVQQLEESITELAGLQKYVEAYDKWQEILRQVPDSLYRSYLKTVSPSFRKHVGDAYHGKIVSLRAEKSYRAVPVYDEYTQLMNNSTKVIRPTMIDIFIKLGQYTRAEQLLDQALDKDWPERVYSLGIKLYGKIKNIEEAEKLYRSGMNKFNERAKLHLREQMFIAYAENNYVKEADALFKELDPVQQKHLEFMLRMHARAGNIEEAEKYLTEMTDKGMTLTVGGVNGKLTLLLQKGNYNEAFEFFTNSVSAKSSNPETFEILMMYLNKISDYDGAIHIFKQILKYGAVPSEKCVNTACFNYARNKDHEKVIDCFKLLLKTRRLPTSTIFATAITSYGCLGDVSGAASVFNMAKQKDRATERVFTAMIAAYVNSGNVSAAEKLLEELTAEMTPTTETFLPFLHEHIKSGDKRAFNQVLAEMQKWGLNPDSQTLNSAITHDNVGVINILKSLDVKPDTSTYNLHLLRASEKKGLSKVHDLITEMSESGVLPNEETFITLLKIYTQHKQLDKAETYFLRLTESGAKISGRVFGAMLNLYCKVGKPKLAQQFFDSFHGHVTQKEYTTLLHMYGKYGFVENAQALFDKIVELNRVDLVAYASIIYSYAHAGYFEEAEKYFAEMKEKGFAPNEYVYGSMIDMYGKLKKPEKAEEYMELMIKEGIKPVVQHYSPLMDMYGKIHDIEKAEKIFDRLRDSHIANLVSYNIMINAYVINGNFDKAIETFNKISRVGFTPDSASYNSVIKAATLHGKYAEAENYYKQMLKQEMYPIASTYNHLVKCLLPTGQTDQINRIISGMMEVSKKEVVDVVSYVMKTYQAQGHPEQVIEIYENALKVGATLVNLSYDMALKAYRDLGKVEEAKKLYWEVDENHEFKPTLYATSLMLQLCASESSEVVEKYFKRIKYPNHVQYSTMLRAYGKDGRLEDAEKLFRRLKAGLTANEANYNTMICAMQGNPIRQQELVTEMKGLGFHLSQQANTALQSNE